MKKIAIITARSGSKRIPKKNIKFFLGKPIIAYSIEKAINSKLFDKVMVSTDDKEIADISKNYGAEVPFFRSKKNSDDFSTTPDVLIEVLETYKKLNEEFDFGCCIYPTAPLISKKELKKSFDILISKKYDCVFPTLPFNYPIQRALRIENSEKVEMINPLNYRVRSQDLEKMYHDAGQFYWFNVSKFINKKKLWTNNTGFIIVDEINTQDIDDEMDWRLAEIKYKNKFKKK